MHRVLQKALLCLWLGSAFAQAQQAAPAQINPTNRSQDAKPFRPGIRIDWHKPAVELDAIVVLRDGPLELLACTPQSREHESILTVAARPLDIYNALGLIGAEPGTPVEYDEKADRLLPAIGQPLDLTIRYALKSGNRTARVHEWLRSPKGNALTEPIDWVFAGSRMVGANRFAADSDGTVICLVDFDAAVVSAGKTHTADNAALWVAANTKEIPPIGTRCVLSLAPASRPSKFITLEILPNGGIQHAGQSIDGTALNDWLGTIRAGKKTLLLRPEPGTSRSKVDQVRSILMDAGIKRSAIRLRQPPSLTPNPRKSRQLP